MTNFKELGERIGALVEEKNKAYGSSFDKAGEFLKLLYPDGIKPEQYTDMLCLVRIFDKQMRIATDKDALGESPYADITGYGLLGLRHSEHNKGLQKLANQIAEVEKQQPEPPAQRRFEDTADRRETELVERRTKPSSSLSLYHNKDCDQ